MPCSVGSACVTKSDNLFRLPGDSTKATKFFSTDMVIWQVKAVLILCDTVSVANNRMELLESGGFF